MEEYKERLVTELKELKEKIFKLGKYYDQLKVEQYEGQKYLLMRQYYAMCDYAVMLERRAQKEDIKLD